MNIQRTVNYMTTVPQQSCRPTKECDEALNFTSRLAQVKIAHRIREGGQENT